MEVGDVELQRGRRMTEIHRGLPTPDETAAPFWESAARGVLVVQRCGDCGSWQHPPMPACKRCTATSVRFHQVSGRARLLTWTDVQHAFVDAWSPDVPFTAFLVELVDAPGVIMPSDDIYFFRRRREPLHLAVGMPMVAAFEPLDDSQYMLPQFVPDPLTSPA